MCIIDASLDLWYAELMLKPECNGASFFLSRHFNKFLITEDTIPLQKVYIKFFNCWFVQIKMINDDAIFCATDKFI